MRVRGYLFFMILSTILLLAENPSIGGSVWYDKNLDGIKNYGEVGIEGVRIELLKDGLATDDVNYTIKDGVYLFEDLEADHNYSIKVILPRNYKSFTIPNVGQSGSEDIRYDNDIIRTEKVVMDDKEYLAGISDPIFLPADRHYRDLDAGITCSCVAWIDIEKSTNGVDGDSSDFAVRVDVGDEVVWNYKVSNSSLVKIVNIKVTDDKEGIIECPKDYLEPNEEMNCTKKGVAKEGLYENLAIVTGEDENGTEVNDEDVSHYIAQNKLGCIGDFYWYDSNLNGVQDKNEAGIIGIKVELYDENRNLLKSTETDDNGQYLFCDLEAGNYYVKFDLPETYLFIPSDRGDDSVDSDADSSGWSHLITLESGEDNLSIDAGIYCSCDDYLVTGETRDMGTISIANIIIVSFIIAFIALTIGEGNKKKHKKH